MAWGQPSPFLGSQPLSDSSYLALISSKVSFLRATSMLPTKSQISQMTSTYSVFIRLFWVIWLLLLAQDATQFNSRNGFTLGKYYIEWQQCQIILTWCILTLHRYNSRPLHLQATSGMLRLTPAIDHLANLCGLSILPIGLNEQNILYATAIVTVWSSYLLLPQATSFLTSPCRPISMNVPQCQDFLHPIPIYITIYWVNFALFCVFDQASRWLGPHKLSKRENEHQSRRNRTICGSRCCIKGILTLICIFFTHDLTPVRFPGSGAVLLSPVKLIESTLFNTFIGGAASLVPLLGYNAFGYLRILSLPISQLTLPDQATVRSNCTFHTALSKTIADTPTRGRYSTLFPPRKKKLLIKHKSRTPRHPSLTPETFVPTTREATMIGHGRYRPRSPKSLPSLKHAALPPELRAPLNSQLMTPEDNHPHVDYINVYCEIESLQTLPPALDGGSLYCDEVLPSWGGDTEPFIRPGSRLGFSNLTPRCGSTRVLVEEYEMEGAAVGLYGRRKSLSSDDRGGFATPLALSISQNETPSTMSSFVAMPLTSPSEASTTPVLYHSEDEADTFASEDGVDRDTIEDLSPKISYDWTKAAHLFLQSSNIPSNQRDDKTTPGEKAVSVKRRGLWHNILEESSLWTIEETSDEERDASNGDNGSISYYSCRG